MWHVLIQRRLLEGRYNYDTIDGGMPLGRRTSLGQRTMHASAGESSIPLTACKGPNRNPDWPTSTPDSAARACAELEMMSKAGLLRISSHCVCAFSGLSRCVS